MDKCEVCGANLALVGRIHRCNPGVSPATESHAATELVAQPSEVNRPAVNGPEVNKEVNRRGAYPNTDKRRSYMQQYMRKKRRGF